MDYNALFNAGIYEVSSDIKVFAGTTDDAFWIDLGGAFDTLNTSKAPPVLSAAEDAANVNLAADTVSGYAVNSIAIEVPIAALTKGGDRARHVNGRDDWCLGHDLSPTDDRAARTAAGPERRDILASSADG